MNLGERLKEERERLGYSQTAFAALAGATKHSQINWEKGVAFPNAAVLATWAEAGLDVTYVVTGQRNFSASTATYTAEEIALVSDFRLCDTQAKAIIRAASQAAAAVVHESKAAHLQRRAV